MNKTQLIDVVAEKSGLSKVQTHEALDAILDALRDVLVEGESINLVGFGTFKINHRNPRVGRNPRTKEEIKIPATDVPAFVPGKPLKEAVNGVAKAK